MGRREFIDFENRLEFYDVVRIYGVGFNILLGWFFKVWIERRFIINEVEFRSVLIVLRKVLEGLGRL